VICWSIFGGLWRRVLGGAKLWFAWSQDLPILKYVWKEKPEGKVIRRDLIVTLSAALPLGLLMWWPWQAYLVVTALSFAVWLPGHNFEDAKALLTRYKLPVALAWILCKRWWPLAEWMGWTEGAEFIAGFLWYGMWYAAAASTSYL
jgi:hypothetical protein